MRRLLFAAPLLVLVTACRGTQPYLAQDVAQVKQGYATITPIYLHFRRAFMKNDAPGILSNYRQEQRACTLIDQINERDSIDPNVNLFSASNVLDNYCNDIEAAYAYWAPRHGYPYDPTVLPSRPLESFIDGDASYKDSQTYIRKPSKLT